MSTSAGTDQTLAASSDETPRPPALILESEQQDEQPQSQNLGEGSAGQPQAEAAHDQPQQQQQPGPGEQAFEVECVLDSRLSDVGEFVEGLQTRVYLVKWKGKPQLRCGLKIIGCLVQVTMRQRTAGSRKRTLLAAAKICLKSFGSSARLRKRSNGSNSSKANIKILDRLRNQSQRCGNAMNQCHLLSSM